MLKSGERRGGLEDEAEADDDDDDDAAAIAGTPTVSSLRLEGGLSQSKRH